MDTVRSSHTMHRYHLPSFLPSFLLFRIPANGSAHARKGSLFYNFG